MSYAELKGFKDNFGFSGIAPSYCKKLIAFKDIDNGAVTLTWSDPEDTIIDGILLSSWKNTRIVRKLGGYPKNPTDGKTVCVNNIRNAYCEDRFVDNDFEEGVDILEYFYKAFPESDTGAVSININNEFINRTAVIYGFKIEIANTDPESRVTYIEDAVNMAPAFMDYTADTFNYGDWKDVFFMPKPCMLKFDGTVDYYLNPDDFTLKEDGTASDVANTSYDGNCMIEFPTVWLKHESDDEFYYCFISNKQVDETYHAYAHTDKHGNIMPFTYMPAYNGANVSSKLRSLSGLTPMHTQTASTEVTYAKANGDNWNIETLSDRILLQSLWVLLGKSTNLQTVFGNGYYTGGSSASNPRINTGTMNKKGMFWGSNGSSMVGVKVFGMEHPWGNQWRRIAGYILDETTQKIKLTEGMQDGSTVDGYNLTGSGYIALENATPSGTSGGYISEMVNTEYGRFAKVASGAETQDECDGLWFNTSKVNVALVGGVSNNGFLAGGFCVDLNDVASNSRWYCGAAISCKPIV